MKDKLVRNKRHLKRIFIRVCEKEEQSKVNSSFAKLFILNEFIRINYGQVEEKNKYE